MDYFRWLAHFRSKGGKNVAELLEDQAAFAINNPGPVLQADLSGKVLLCNPAADRMFQGCVGGKSISDLLSPLHNFNIEEFPDLQPFQFEDNIGERTFLVTLIKHKPAKSLFLYGSDITELKNLEKMKDSLTQMIVHDLNNPLMILYGNLQLLEMDLQDFLSDDQRDKLNVALNKSQEMKDMISDLLDINKMEEGKLKLVRVEIRLRLIINEIVDAMNILAKPEGKKISAKLPPDPPPFTADRDLLKRIIYNLIGNALKFSPPGSEIKITANYKEADKEVLINVEDQGVGIAEEYHSRIFDKFIQVEGGRRLSARSGKGLGLTFCKMAVEAHGGKIWLKSEVGKGTTFYFTIPIKEGGI